MAHRARRSCRTATKAAQEAHASISHTTQRRTLEQQANSKHENNLKPVEDLPPVVLRSQKQRDNIPINSIEEHSHSPSLPTGIDHYMQKLREQDLDTKPSLHHTEYKAPANKSSDTEPHDLALTPPTPHTPHSPHTTMTAPKPAHSPKHYSAPIYTGTTHNPAIFLSILSIAQSNRTDLDITSALNHIPNIRPTDRIPVLRPAAKGNPAPQPFLEHGVVPPKRDGDDDVTVAFLPHFYDAGHAHALGFYSILHCPLRGKVLGTAFFTPCSEADLKRYGLVEYVDPQDGFGGGGVETMSRVGCLRGEWVERDTVEEYDEWKLAFRVASVTWEGRVQLVKGATEG